MPTIDASTVVSHIDEIIYQETWSAIVPGQPTDLSWTASDGPALAPYKVLLTVVTPPTDGSTVDLHRDTTNDAVASRTIRVIVDTPPGGSLTGCIARIQLYWKEQSSGGISTGSTAIVSA